MKKEFYLKQVKRSNLFYFFLLILTFFILIGCSKEKIEEDTAVRIYVENIILEEKYASNVDSIKFYQKKLFEKYHITKNQFENYLKSLKADIKKWQIFFNKAEIYLNDLKNTGAIN